MSPSFFYFTTFLPIVYIYYYIYILLYIIYIYYYIYYYRYYYIYIYYYIYYYYIIVYIYIIIYYIIIIWYIYIPTKFQHHIESERKLRQFASLIMFLAKCSPVNWLPWQQEMAYPKVFNF